MLPMLSCLILIHSATCQVQLEPSEGWVIFDPTKDGFAYRYGPSILLNADASLDVWFASPGGPGCDGIHQWDWLRHKNSKDGGKTWGEESIVLKPTEGSKDRMSVCDPGVIHWGGYYFLGYTAVDNPEGYRNEVFVARSKNPTGPYEKWDGKGWGGSPQPIIPFTGPADCWGAGEPSLVLLDDTLYVYYSWLSRDAEGKPITQTHVATAPASASDWPAHLKIRGTAIQRVEGEDSTDVKYLDDFGCFLAISTANRLTAESFVAIRTSRDGLTFGEPVHLQQNIKPWCHNIGISGTLHGHISPKDQTFVSYAYSSEGGVSWAFWYTWLNPIVIHPAD